MPDPTTLTSIRGERNRLQNIPTNAGPEISQTESESQIAMFVLMQYLRARRN